MGRELSSQIVQAVADKRGVDPVELDFVLQDYVDADALRLLSEHESSRWSLTFSLPDHEVTVTSQNEIKVEKREYEPVRPSSE